ncbi:MAG: IclR family transcriptional regulator [Caulobacter sp.]|nr:IclR family transcriptional regulator [Caulobacter sp.]
MERKASIEAKAAAEADGKPSGSQTLLRGLDVIEKVAEGPISLADLAESLGLTRSTTYRLAAALVDRRMLVLRPREGYALGPKLLELGYSAREQMHLPQVARPYLEQLSAATSDTVHLGVLEGDEALYLDKVPGRRRVEIGSRIGERQPLSSTGLGKALILDMDEERWKQLFTAEAGPRAVGLPVWLERMRGYAAAGHAYDLEENEDQIRCVAAPIRGVDGHTVGAISLSSAAQYMDDARMESLSTEVRACAEAISRELGWSERVQRPRSKR